MIAKRIERKKKGCVKKLCEYIRDVKNDGKKVAHEWQTNCIADNLPLATKEIQNTQELNARSKKNDKTYHLVFSFRQGEKPALENLKKMENYLCEAIGLGEHQRICVAHKDTENYHVHLAISKVHPKTYNCIEPYYDKKKLQKSCIEIEKMFDLEPEPRKNKEKYKVSEVEAKSGLESFKGWIKKNVASELKTYLAKDGASWQGAQSLLIENGIKIRKHGAGLVFSHHKNKLFVKVSSVDRAFSIKKLEDKLGEFKEAEHSSAPKKEYTKKPIHNSAYLWEEYSNIQNDMKRKKAHKIENIRHRRKEMYSKIQRELLEKRQKIKLDAYMSKTQKKAMYSKIKAESLEKKKKVQAEISEKMTHIFANHKNKPWNSYLVDKAKNGNIEALKTLRKKGNSINIPDTNVVYTSLTYKEVTWTRTIDHITREGYVRYKVPGGMISDEGRRITLGKSPSKEAVTVALELALEKFGRNLKIDGTKEFKQLASEIISRDRRFKIPQKGLEIN